MDMTAKDHIKEKLIVSKEDWIREMEEYASIKTKELEKQLQKEAMKQLSLLDKIKELEEENKRLKETMIGIKTLSDFGQKLCQNMQNIDPAIQEAINNNFDKLINTK